MYIPADGTWLVRLSGFLVRVIDTGSAQVTDETCAHIRPVQPLPLPEVTAIPGQPFPLAFDHQHWLLSQPVPALTLVTGLTAAITVAGHIQHWTQHGSYVPHAQDLSREGCRRYPGSSGVQSTSMVPLAPTCRFSAANPAPRATTTIHPRLTLTRRYRQFTHVHPSAPSPSLHPGWIEHASASTPGFRAAATSSARPGGDEPNTR